MGRENKRPNPSEGGQAKRKQTVKGRSTQHVNPRDNAPAVVIDLEKEHNATGSQQNPVRYSNSERPQRGRRVKIAARKV